jgi:hypothetical protein
MPLKANRESACAKSQAQVSASLSLALLKAFMDMSIRLDGQSLAQDSLMVARELTEVPDQPEPQVDLVQGYKYHLQLSWRPSSDSV